jgi:cytochrome b561
LRFLARQEAAGYFSRIQRPGGGPDTAAFRLQSCLRQSACPAPPRPEQASPMVAYTSFAVFIFCALSLVISSGFSYGAALLFLGALALLWKRPTLGMTRDDRLLCWVFAGYFLLHALENGLHHAVLREYDACR